MSRRLYLGRLSPDTRNEDVQDMFKNYGRIIDCRVMTGFGFVEFENEKDAEDAVQEFNGKNFMGQTIVVEFAKESRPRREAPFDRRDRDRDFGQSRRRPQGIRLIVSDVSRDTSWQDLKDFGREAGNVIFADIDRDVPGQGILEYTSRDDADRAVKDLDGKELRGRSVRVTIDENRGGPDNYRRDDRRDNRRDDRYRDDRRDDRDRYRDDRRDDRHRDDRADRPREDRSRKDRSRSPRRDYDDRRDRDRGERDDRRRGGDEDREPSRRDDRRREEKD